MTGDVNTAGLQWDYATNWSNGGIDLMSCLIPGVAGGGTSEPVDANSELLKSLRKKVTMHPSDLKPHCIGETFLLPVAHFILVLSCVCCLFWVCLLLRAQSNGGLAFQSVWVC